MLKSKEKETRKDTEKRKRRERQPSNHLIVSQTEYICIDNEDAPDRSRSLALFAKRKVIYRLSPVKVLAWSEMKKGF